MKSVLISIKPKWCELIANGKKTIEVRKTRPKCDMPFKCYIYCTLSELLTKSHFNGKIYVSNKKYQNALERNGNTTLSGKVIGEFICNNIYTYDDDTIFAFRHEDYTRWNDFDLNRACIHPEDFQNYSNGKWLYGWRISDLVIYDKPKDLDDFMVLGEAHCNQKNCDKCLYMGIDGICDVKDIGQPIIRPPQSWCYCEEVKL